jgi:hypothetical protein
MSLILMGCDDFAPLPPILGENRNSKSPRIGGFRGLFFNPSELMTQTNTLREAETSTAVNYLFFALLKNLQDENINDK